MRKFRKVICAVFEKYCTTCFPYCLGSQFGPLFPKISRMENTFDMQFSPKRGPYESLTAYWKSEKSNELFSRKFKQRICGDLRDQHFSPFSQISQEGKSFWHAVFTQTSPLSASNCMHKIRKICRAKSEKEYITHYWFVFRIRISA